MAKTIQTPRKLLAMTSFRAERCPIGPLNNTPTIARIKPTTRMYSMRETIVFVQLAFRMKAGMMARAAPEIRPAACNLQSKCEAQFDP